MVLPGENTKLFVGAIIIIIITDREQQKSAASTEQSFQELTQSQLEGDCATAWLFSIGLDIRWWWWWCCVSIWSPPWAASAASSMCNIVHIFKHHKDHIRWAISGRRRATLLVTGARRCGLIRRERCSSSVFVSSSQLDCLLLSFFVLLLTSCFAFQGAECRAWVADAHMAREVTRWWGATNIMIISRTTSFYHHFILLNNHQRFPCDKLAMQRHCGRCLGNKSEGSVEQCWWGPLAQLLIKENQMYWYRKPRGMDRAGRSSSG